MLISGTAFLRLRTNAKAVSYPYVKNHSGPLAGRPFAMPGSFQLQGAHLMSAYGHGRHEHGQNFLTDHKFINSIIDLVKQTSGPSLR